VVAGGVSSWVDRPIDKLGRLSESGRRTFRAISITVLEGTIRPPGPERERQLDAHLERLDQVLAAFPQETQREIAQLLALLGNAATRYALTGLPGPWHESSATDTTRALNRMRHSSIALRQQAYHALRDLTNAAFYADPVAWPLMGYPGPASL
jgi:hypothetical protein